MRSQHLIYLVTLLDELAKAKEEVTKREQKLRRSLQKASEPIAEFALSVFLSPLYTCLRFYACDDLILLYRLSAASTALESRVETLHREIEALRSTAALPAVRSTLLQLDEEISTMQGLNSNAQRLLDECSTERVCASSFTPLC